MRHVPSDVIKPVSCCSCSRIHVGCRSAGSILHRNRPQNNLGTPDLAHREAIRMRVLCMQTFR